MTKPFEIVIEKIIGGLAPAYWKTTYPSEGNRNMAGRLRNVDLSSPHSFVQGPGRLTLTAGDQTGTVTTLIRSIMRMAVGSDDTFAIGGTRLYRLASDSVGNSAGFPHTLTGTNPDGEDVTEYHNKIYYTYNHSSAGEMGQLTLPNTFDDDFLSTIPAVGSFSLKTGVPHQIIVGGDDILYITNGNYISSYDATTDTAVQIAIDLPNDFVATSIAWNLKKLYIVGNSPNLDGNNRTQKNLYIWNTIDSSWETNVPSLNKAGGLFVNSDGILFIFYEDITGDKTSVLGYFDGASIRKVSEFDGDLPKYYQITEREGFIVWVTNDGTEDLVWAWGKPGENIRLFQLMKGTHAYLGAISAPFGKLLVASADTSGGTTSCDISKEYGYETDAYYKSLLFNIKLDGRTGIITKLTVDIEEPSSGAGMLFKLVDNKGVTHYTGTLSYELDGAVTSKIFNMIKRTENVRIEFDPSSYSSTTAIKVRRIILNGHAVD